MSVLSSGPLPPRRLVEDLFQYNTDDPMMTVLLTPAEAAERLSLSRSTIYTLIEQGHLRAVKIGRARRIPLRSLHEFVKVLVAEHPSEGIAQPSVTLGAMKDAL